MRGGDGLEGVGEGGELLLAFRADLRRAGVEQHLRLEDEAVADDLDVGAVAQHLAQLAEELRAIAGELLDLVRQGLVESLAEIDHLDLVGLGLGLRGVQRGDEPGELLAQRQELGVQHLDLELRFRPEAPLLVGLGAALGQLLLQLVAGRRFGGKLLLQALAGAAWLAASCCCKILRLC